VSPKLPSVTARELLRALRRDGWAQVRQRVSHVVFRHSVKSGRVVVAVHVGQIVPVGTLEAILDQAGLSGEELRELL
jgi:predicted RNA binding protein YcfA (HicA-like mRNA interferase family)